MTPDQKGAFRRIEVARRDADDVSASIAAGKRVVHSRTEDLRNHVRYLADALERALLERNPS